MDLHKGKREIFVKVIGYSIELHPESRDEEDKAAWTESPKDTDQSANVCVEICCLKVQSERNREKRDRDTEIQDNKETQREGGRDIEIHRSTKTERQKDRDGEIERQVWLMLRWSSWQVDAVTVELPWQEQRSLKDAVSQSGSIWLYLQTTSVRTK